jgi:hypothetical protein
VVKLGDVSLAKQVDRWLSREMVGLSSEMGG